MLDSLYFPFKGVNISHLLNYVLQISAFFVPLCSAPALFANSLRGEGAVSKTCFPMIWTRFEITGIVSTYPYHRKIAALLDMYGNHYVFLLLKYFYF